MSQLEPERILPNSPWSYEPIGSEKWAEWFNRIIGAVRKTSLHEVTLTPSSVSAGATSKQTFTVTGLTVNDIVTVNPPTTNTSIIISLPRVSAADTLELVFYNNSGGALTPNAGNYLIKATRK